MVTLLAFRLPPLFLLLLLLLAASAAADVDEDADSPEAAGAPAGVTKGVDEDGDNPEAGAPEAETKAALVNLKKSFADPTGKLAAWSVSSPLPPCDAASPWPGLQCYKGGLYGIRLTRLNLTGTFDFAAIAKLPGIHIVNLKYNALSGPLPASVATVRSLRALYLSDNNFSGPIPADVFKNMRWLKKLYVDDNRITGPLPADAIAGARRLMELHLDRNQIEGHVPDKLPESLKRFNVSHNRLSGTIPKSVAERFDASSFSGNPALCGSPGSDDAACVAAGDAVREARPPVYGTNPPAMPMAPPPKAADYMKMEEETSVFVVIGIILLVILLVSGAMVLMLRQDEGNSPPPAWDYYDAGAAGAGAGAGNAAASAGSTTAAREREMVAVDLAAGGGSSSHGGSGAGGGRRIGEFVLLDESIPAFGLPDLMKATAEVLGNGTLGSAYKAAMRNGVTVAVKRLRDMNRAGREDFEQHLSTLGGLRHPNVLPPVGYHYRKEEKLIVSEYMPRGSLLYILHGDQSPNRAILDWPGRLRIAVGVVRGLAYLHERLGTEEAGRAASMDEADFDGPPPPPPHGNLKSGNVLLGADMEPRLVDYGFFPLVDAAQAPQAMFAFRSPEGTTRNVVSPRSDVYCLGVVLLELVTGRFPSQYLLTARGGTDVVHWAAAAVAEGGEKDLVDPAIAAAGGAAAVGLLRVGVRCANPEPECRPTVAEAARMVEEIGGGRGRAS